MLLNRLDDRKVELVCAECGYGIVVATVPDTCPVCHASSWDLPAWRPFSALAEFHDIFDKAGEVPEPAQPQPPAFDPLELVASASRPPKRRATVASST
jgi:hypothetical protein